MIGIIVIYIIYLTKISALIKEAGGDVYVRFKRMSCMTRQAVVIYKDGGFYEKGIESFKKSKILKNQKISFHSKRIE